jgi:hypothetical protein
VGWVLEVLGAGSQQNGDEDEENAVDVALTQALANGPWQGPYDLIDGLVGYGVYALERLPRPAAKKLVSLVVDRLAEAAARRAPGVAWKTDPRWLPPEVRAHQTTWNLGLAHGAPGAIGFLGRVCAADVASRTQRKARTLLERAVAWLLAQELPADEVSRFPYGLRDGEPPAPARLAWCYGDAGVAAALLIAARGAGQKSWEKAATRIALAAAARPLDTAGVHDAGLCHGAAGVGHAFHRMYQATGEEALARSARAWFRRALEMRTDRGFGGWLSSEPDGRGDVKMRPSPAFLTGTGGVTLALLAATGDIEDATWDRALVLSG